MRILFLCHRYLDTTLGGVAEFLHHLPLALKVHDAEVIIYTRASKDGPNRLASPEILENHIPHFSGPFLKPRFFISKKELQPFLSLCEKEKIDLIHAQGTYRAGFMAMHAHKQTGIPYIVTSHSDISAVNSQRIQRGNIKRRCKKVLEKANFVTHLAPAMQEASDSIHVTNHKSQIIHNGIDVAAWEKVLNQPEQDYMLAIGRLEPEKGFPLLIDAYAGLRKKGFRTSLVIAGTGSIEKELEQQARNYGFNVLTDFRDTSSIPSESIIFPGYIRAQAKKDLFSHAKLVLFATQPQACEEAFGIVQLEAMAAGKPLIASDIAAARYLQSRGMQALLVTPDSQHAWTEAMHALLYDDNLRHVMGQNNQKAVKQFDWIHIAKEYRVVYEAVLTEKTLR
ncbi:glycosyltransferase family 4 protein [Aquicella lusitana]|uniref:Glycosyltransferase involved in cell wall biosynthesis n=1 Tax=Aquicella lusitana TaxID=254246 RepID=A0A370GM16_9COXI|nr:glycosyltransferase family 4 protein [Aquicella lusitana]RDI44765.1 glycosyltransferase involved in cell wall biosynthesis [Aquicella lusitana]VVC72962.1 D-inositol 3-phosphate glycosyltransferase [Aquicella lusitana]